ncbi:hypothetical protein B0H11DRAFT_2255091 [Mycena galericulata]|nr:hypothetical protein B0H11DRAFT_2255091 [Mycena galericulata]
MQFYEEFPRCGPPSQKTLDGCQSRLGPPSFFRALSSAMQTYALGGSGTTISTARARCFPVAVLLHGDDAPVFARLSSGTRGILRRRGLDIPVPYTPRLGGRVSPRASLATSVEELCASARILTPSLVAQRLPRRSFRPSIRGSRKPWNLCYTRTATMYFHSCASSTVVAPKIEHVELRELELNSKAGHTEFYDVGGLDTPVPYTVRTSPSRNYAPSARVLKLSSTLDVARAWPDSPFLHGLCAACLPATRPALAFRLRLARVRPPCWSLELPLPRRWGAFFGYGSSSIPRPNPFLLGASSLGRASQSVVRLHWDSRATVGRRGHPVLGLEGASRTPFARSVSGVRITRTLDRHAGYDDHPRTQLLAGAEVPMIPLSPSKNYTASVRPYAVLGSARLPWRSYRSNVTSLRSAEYATTYARLHPRCRLHKEVNVELAPKTQVAVSSSWRANSL